MISKYRNISTDNLFTDYDSKADDGASFSVSDATIAENSSYLDIPVEEEPLVPPSAHKSSWLLTLFNLTNTSIGAGTLALPYSISQSGLLMGMVMISAIGFMSWVSLYFLTITGMLCKEKTYSGIARSLFGPVGERTVSLIMFALLLGPLSAYFLIINSNIELVLEGLFGNDDNDADIKRWNLIITLIVTFVVILPLSLLKSLKHVAYASTFALVAMFYTIFLIPASYFYDLYMGKIPQMHIQWWVKPGFSILSAFSTIGMAFVNHPVVVECVSELANNDPVRSHSLTTTSSTVVTLVYLLVGASGYLHHGDYVKGNILDSESSVSVWFQLSRISVAICIALSYPLLLAPARNSLDSFITSLIESSSNESLREKWKRLRELRFYVTSIAIIGFSFFLFLSIPGLGKIFALFGSLTGSLVVYVIPAVFYVGIMKEHQFVELTKGYLVRRVSSGDSSVNETYSETTALLQQRIVLTPNSEQFLMKPKWYHLCGVYLNVFIGIFLFMVGSAYAIMDLFEDGTND
jgi:amino acid permease